MNLKRTIAGTTLACLLAGVFICPAMAQGEAPASAAAPPPDPFQLPLQPIASLDRKSGSAPGQPWTHVRGTLVDYRAGEYLVIRDVTGFIFAETPLTAIPKLKETVDVVGTVVWEGSQVRIRNTRFRLAGSAASTSTNETESTLVKPAELPVLTKAWQVRDLSPEKAAWNYPVAMRGVVTYYVRDRRLCVQDEISGIYVRLAGRAPSLSLGDVVEIQGVSEPGGYAPIIATSNITVVGKANLPEPRQATVYQLNSDQEGSQWIEVHGVVRSVTHSRGEAHLILNDPTGRLPITLQTSKAPTNLLDAVVRIRGVSASTSNKQRQFLGPSMLCPSLNFVTIEEAALADPLDLPVRPIVTLSQFRPRLTLERRTKVAGVVTLCQPGQWFYLQDGSDGAQVFTAQTNGVQPGARVTAAGYPAVGNYGTVLRDAIFQADGTTNLPRPELLKTSQELAPHLHNHWVQADGHLLSCSQIGNIDVLKLQFGNRVIEANCLNPNSTLKRIRAGSLLRLTGVYTILADESRSPVSFQILVPDAAQVQILQQPSRWTSRHTVTTIGILAVTLTAITLWVIMLRRKVAEQTASLQESETKFRTLVEKSLVGVYLIQDGFFVYSNPRLGEIFGYTAGEIIGLPLEAIIAPDDIANVQEQIQRRVTGEVSTVHYQFHGLRKDGQRVLVEVLGSRSEYHGRPAVLGTAMDITERKRAADELFNSRQMLRTVLDTIPQRVFWKDRDSVYSGCNQAFAADCACARPDDLVGKTDRDISPPDLAEAYQAEDREILESGRPRLNREIPLQKPDGTERWLRVSKVPLFDHRGQVSGVLGTYEDITEHKQAAAALAEASSLAETLLTNSPDHIYFKDLESRFVRASQSMGRLFNLQDTQELVGKSDFDFFRTEHAQNAFDDEQQIIRTGIPIVGKPEREIHMDGRVSWALTTKLPWRNQNGEIIGTFGISKDVTELKLTEEKLAREKGLFRALVENVPDAIYFKDRQSRFARLSKSKVERSRQALIKKYRATNGSGELPAHLADVERCAEFLIGKTDFDVFPEERARFAYEQEQEILRTGIPLIGNIERYLHPEDGSTIWYHTTKMPWLDEDGNTIGTFGVTRDITALKEAEAQLEAAHQRLMETSRLAGMAEVATDVLHNVGNVLNSVNISGSLTIERIRSSKMTSLSKVVSLLDEHASRLGEFFERDPRGQQIPGYLSALAGQLRDDQAMLLKELEQLLKHIDHIKQIVAMQQSYAKVAGVRETISTTQLVEDALHINAAALTRHDVHVRREFSPTPLISTEKHKVLQILVNLIRNAKYAMDDARRMDKLLTLRVGTNAAGDVEIQVIDNGVGIPAENLTRIFGHGFTTRKNGHGFGLHSSALSVRELGGSLQAHSDGPGTGATFILTLPSQTKPQTEIEEYESAAQ